MLNLTLHPCNCIQAITNIKGTLKPGTGAVLVRDYAAGDLAEQRLARVGRHKRLGPHLYMRGDGTKCLYFTQVRACLLAWTGAGMPRCSMPLARSPVYAEGMLGDDAL